MANIPKVAALFLGLGSLLGTALPADRDLDIVANIEAVNSTEIPAAGCIATSYSQIPSIVAACSTSTLQDISVPVGGQIKLSGLTGKTIQFAGKISFAPSPGGRSPTEPLIMFSQSSNMKIIGLEGNILHGHGEEYWDGGGGNKGVKKPKFMRIEKITDSTIERLHVVNAPVHCFAISGSSHVTLNGIKLDSSMGDKKCSELTRTNNRADVGGGKSCGHNSDGFGVSGSQHIKIMNVVVNNQDDCLAVNSGSDITFENNYCSGGHGVSIGSIKSGARVSGVHVANTTIRNSENGVRIKTYDDATDASVSDITYKDITLIGIQKFGIIIQQDYRNDGPTGKAGNVVPIKGVSLRNVAGTIAGGKGQAVYINCGRGTCSNWDFSGIAITGGRIVKAAPSGCIQAPASAAAFCKGSSG